MQIKILSVPVIGGEAMNEELNKFLRSVKVIQIEQQLVDGSGGAVWSFSIKYMEDYSPTGGKREKPDYKQVLDAASFARFSKMRVIRKQIAKDRAIPAYAVFTDKELAALAEIEKLTEAKMKSVEGVGEEKVAQFGHFFITPPSDGKS